VYDSVCSHGYVSGSCSECREAARQAAESDAMGERFNRYTELHKGGQRAGWLTRRTEITASLARLEGYSRRTNAQDAELDELTAELTVLGSLVDQDDVRVRSETISRMQELAKDPANCEGPEDGSHGALARGAPALVKGLGDRRETAAETMTRFRASNPWRSEDGPVNRADTAAGLMARAHTALEGLEGQLTRGGCERLAQAMAEETAWPGVMIRRSREEQAEAAELVLALSNPHYAQAFRSALRWPMEFTSGGTGFESLSDEERRAWRDVRTNMSCRAAFAEATGAAGAFAIPLDLHPDIILTNAGSANPFRALSRVVISTTNVAEFVTSAGSTANWLAEGTGVADTTPTLGQLAITHYKEAVWIYGSFEVLQDAALGTQVPALIADAKDRLEVAAFALGTGSAQPFGILVHGTSDATATVLTAALVYALHQNLPPRFRVGEHAKPVWLANVAIINALRQIPSFTGSVTSLVNDNQPDSIPEMLSIDVYECSAMASAQTAGNKTLAIADMNSFIITSRQPELLIYEPLVKATATGFPTGQAGWFSWSRTGSDLAVATACQYHTD